MAAQLEINKQKVGKLCLFVLPAVTFMLTSQFLGHKNEGSIWVKYTKRPFQWRICASNEKNLIRLDDGTDIK